MVALFLNALFAVLFLFGFAALIDSDAVWKQWAGTVALFGMASVGVASAGVTVLSARHEGKWGWVGLVLGLVYLGLPWVIPHAVGIIHIVIFPAAFTVGVAVVNTLSRKPKQ